MERCESYSYHSLLNWKGGIRSGGLLLRLDLAFSACRLAGQGIHLQASHRHLLLWHLSEGGAYGDGAFLEHECGRAD
jgi:hypothetical protein